MYDLLWIVDGKVKEVILNNKSYIVCKTKGSLLKNTTHKTGLLQPRKSIQKPKGGWR
jgi:hypothetical protein